ncbi:MAG: cytochrome P450 [Candidatus Nanopelagicales bacterium]|nr:cytochrome P450 [Candidatus Nanopelagicales bacterium]
MRDVELPTRDGQPYDLDFRFRMALGAVDAAKVSQPKDVPRPPGPNGRAIVLNALTRRRSMANSMVDVATQFPRIAHTKLRGEDTYILTHPETILAVMQTHGRDTSKGRGLQVAKVILGDGLLTSEGEDHLRARRMIQPAFHKSRIASYAQDMVGSAVIHEQKWHYGKTIEVVGDMSSLTLAIVGKALFGSDLSGDASEVSEALSAVLERFQFLMLPGARTTFRLPIKRNRDLREAVDRLDMLVQRLITEHRAAGDNGDLLSMMIAAQEDGFAMDDAQLRDEAMTMVLAGHETTAMALSWTWYLLARNPSATQRLHAELDEVLAGRTPTFDDFAALPFTTACVAESMRLYPPAWMIGRRALTDIQVDEWTIPEGSLILASAFAMHRDPRFWPASLGYQPQRWLTAEGRFSESAPGAPRGAWFPFGFSNRRCIGDQFAWTEAVLVLATLASKWRLELTPGTVATAAPAITLRPGGGISMVTHQR